MKKLILGIIFIFSFHNSVTAQTSGYINVGGDFDKFYPVLWRDANWWTHSKTELNIGRSDVHENSLWRGSLIANFSFHTTRWGNGSNYIDADIKAGVTTFVAGWHDATGNNANWDIIIWLRGGGTTYHYSANANVNPIVYDGIQNSLPFQETNGPSINYKTFVDNYVNSSGQSIGNSVYLNSGGTNVIAGNLTIGTTDAKGYKLAVAGNIIAEEVKVKLQGQWPDYVFEKDYPMKSLPELEGFIKTNHHLPDVPSSSEVQKEGINIGEMNAILLKKVEELTLHLIDIKKENQEMKNEIAELKMIVKSN